MSKRIKITAGLAGFLLAIMSAGLYFAPQPSADVFSPSNSSQGLSDITAIAAGCHTGYALKNDGTVWAWGSSEFGQLGDGAPFIDKDNFSTGKDSYLPAMIASLQGVTALWAGSGCTTYARKNDGTVWAWGNDSSHQLGDGQKTSQSSPILISGLYGSTMIDSGRAVAVSLKNDGTVWAWGNLAINGLPEGTMGELPGLGHVSAVATGYDASYYFLKDGTVWDFGRNDYGQLGNGSTAAGSTPAQVPNLTSVSAIATGGDTVYALKSDATVWAWGENEYGQLGNTTKTYGQGSTPTQIPTLSGVTAIAGGSCSGYALKSDGTVWTWGCAASRLKSILTPIQVPGLSNVSAIVAGDDTEYFLKSDGTVWAWGNSIFGALGDGDPYNYNATSAGRPVQVGVDLSIKASQAPSNSPSVMISTTPSVAAGTSSASPTPSASSNSPTTTPLSSSTDQPSVQSTDQPASDQTASLPSPPPKSAKDQMNDATSLTQLNSLKTQAIADAKAQAASDYTAAQARDKGNRKALASDKKAYTKALSTATNSINTIYKAKKKALTKKK